tara:strand:+ start:290 stop:502 length:213 start_codon:yes stop_codon:yes gene_type:complete
MGRINYTIPDENTEERLEILEGIAEDINLMIADTKLAIVYKAQHTKEDERGNDYDDDDDWFYSDDDEENY